MAAAQINATLRHYAGKFRFKKGYIADMFDVLVYVYEHYWRGDV